MTFVKTISEDQAEGMVHDLYKAAQESMGYVPNYAQAMSLHPEVYDAWLKLIHLYPHLLPIRSQLDPPAAVGAQGTRCFFDQPGREKYRGFEGVL